MNTVTKLISTNPNFIPFKDWFENKLTTVSPEVAETMRQAMAAKEAANPGPNTSIVVKAGVVEVYPNGDTNVQVPGFDEIYDQWITEFGVVETVEPA
jgi:hypothetical protein